MSLGDSGGASTSGRSGAGLSAAPPRGYSSPEDTWDADDGGYTPFPSNLPTAPSHGEAWRGGEHRGGGGAPSGVGKQSYELWQYTNSLHYSTADAGDLWRTLTNVRPSKLRHKLKSMRAPVAGSAHKASVLIRFETGAKGFSGMV